MAFSNDDGRDQNRYRGLPDAPPPKLIRGNEVSYPTVRDRLSSESTSSGNASRLRPARDAGMSITRRATREKNLAAARRRNALIWSGIVVVALVAIGVAWQTSSDHRAAATPLLNRAEAPAASIKPLTKPADPTPIFATYKGLEIRLPVQLKNLSEVGFHQASYDYALKLDTPLPDADMTKAKADKGTGRDLSKQQTGPNAVLTGSVLRMWRSRPGQPDTSADVGATPGSPVLAPVTGTVVLVKHYKLYKRYSDYQIHIQPDGYPTVDCVLIHLKNPVVVAGARVTAGVTQLASVRKFSDKINLQLAHYTTKTGDHTHIQLNDTTSPDYHGLKGAIKVGQ